MSDPFLFGNSSLPDELDARVRSELDHGEQLLWVGQPRPRRSAYLVAIPFVLFGIPWTAFSLNWTAMAFSMVGGAPNGWPGMGMLVSLFGVPFVLTGLGMLSSPFWLRFALRRRATRTCYALTDRRAILWEAGLFGIGSVEVRSYRPADLTTIIRRDYGDGSGDVVFEEQRTHHEDTTAGKQGHGFMSIDNVREIEELLRKALLSADRR